MQIFLTHCRSLKGYFLHPESYERILNPIVSGPKFLFLVIYDQGRNKNSVLGEKTEYGDIIPCTKTFHF